MEKSPTTCVSNGSDTSCQFQPSLFKKKKQQGSDHKIGQPEFGFGSSVGCIAHPDCSIGWLFGDIHYFLIFNSCCELSPQLRIFFYIRHEIHRFCVVQPWLWEEQNLWLFGDVDLQEAVSSDCLLYPHRLPETHSAFWTEAKFQWERQTEQNLLRLYSQSSDFILLEWTSLTWLELSHFFKNV